MNAGTCVPKRSFIAPIIVGPRNPPTFAIVTTNAIPAAAGAPVRNRVGKRPKRSVSRAVPDRNERQRQDGQNRLSQKSATKKSGAHNEQWNRYMQGRSSVRSECALFNSITMIVTALINPMIRFLRPSR